MKLIYDHDEQVNCFYCDRDLTDALTHRMTREGFICWMCETILARVLNDGCAEPDDEDDVDNEDEPIHRFFGVKPFPTRFSHN